jgi:hypothetical protein
LKLPRENLSQPAPFLHSLKGPIIGGDPLKGLVVAGHRVSFSDKTVHYQTHPHLRRYSELQQKWHILKLLWILRTLLMRRTLIITFVLAALSLAAANGSPVHRAKTHRSASSAATSHHSRNSRKNSRFRAAGTARRAAVHEVRYAELPEPVLEPEREKSRRNTRKHRAEAETVSLRLSQPIPPPLRGSMESLVRQNDKTEADNLERIEDEDDLADRIARKMLVPVPTSVALTINGNLPESHRYCRPWTAQFLSDLARIHRAEFHRPLEVSSAVRTVEYQKQLMETNGNAAPAEGDVASPHLTGATIDIAKQGMSREEMGWMRGWLLPLQQAGKIDVEEEFQQACFHITVYKSYLPPTPPAPARASAPPKTPAKARSRKPTQQTEPPALPAPSESASQGF